MQEIEKGVLNLRNQSLELVDAIFESLSRDTTKKVIIVLLDIYSEV
jgi:hypothetical protein